MSILETQRVLSGMRRNFRRGRFITIGRGLHARTLKKFQGVPTKIGRPSWMDRAAWNEAQNKLPI